MHSGRKTLRRFLVYLAIAAAVLLIALALVWGYGTCRFSSSTFGGRYDCYINRIDTLTEHGGVTVALRYVRAVIYPDNGYAMVHVVLHHVGDLAFQESPDIHSLYSYLMPYLPLINEPGLMNGNDGTDGFVHGYVTEYITSLNEPIPQIMDELCHGETKIQGIPIGESDCYHMLGHAVMHAVGNDLDRSLRYCDMTPDTVARDGCYYGVFMEDSFLYSPEYHAESPRPDVQGDSMQAVCDRFTGQRAISCATFVGESYFVLHPSDVGAAFKKCLALTSNNSVCVDRLGSVLVASLSKSAADAAAMCSRYAGSYAAGCTHAATESVQYGYGIPVGQAILVLASNIYESIALSIQIAATKAGLPM